MALPRHFFAPSFRHRRLGRFFAVLVGIMVFLATFSMAAEATLSAATLTWDRGMGVRLTVEIPAVGDEATTPQPARIEQTLAVLRAMPGLASVTRVSDADAEALLKPWISQPELLKALPIPALIDIERKPDSLLTAADIRQQLKTVVPDVRIDDHAVWLNDLSHLVRGLTLLGGLMIVLTALALVIAVSLLCRAIMSAERETISLLHIMGAEDGDIAGHFAYHARSLALAAAFGGFFPALAAAGGMIYFMRNFVDAGTVTPLYWAGLGAALVAVPLFAVAISSFSARHAALHDLAEMP